MADKAYLRTEVTPEDLVNIKVKAAHDGKTVFQVLRLLAIAYGNGEISFISKVRKTSLHNNTPKVSKNVAPVSLRKRSLHNIS